MDEKVLDGIERGAFDDLNIRIDREVQSWRDQYKTALKGSKLAAIECLALAQCLLLTDYQNGTITMDKMLLNGNQNLERAKVALERNFMSFN